METDEFRFDTSVTRWWSKLEAKRHPLDEATRGKVSSAILEEVEPLEEALLVNEVLYMLQGLECEVFVLEWTEREGEEDVNEDSMTSKRFESLWRWTIRKRASTRLRHTHHAPSLASLTSRSLISQLDHFIRLATSLSRLRKTIEVARKNYGSSTSIFASCLEEHIKSVESILQQIQAYHQLHPSQQNSSAEARNGTGDASSSVLSKLLLLASQSGSQTVFDLSSPHITLIGLHTMIGRLREVVEYLERISKSATAPLPSLDYSPHVDDLYPDRPKKSKASRSSTIFSTLETEMLQAESEWKQTMLMRFSWRLLVPLLEKIDLWTIHSYLSLEDMDEFCVIKLGSLAGESLDVIFDSHPDSHLASSHAAATRHEAPQSSSLSYDVTSPLFWDHSFAVNEDYPTFLTSSISHLLACGKASLLIKYIQQEILHQHIESIGLHKGYEPLLVSAQNNLSRLLLPFNASLNFSSSPDLFSLDALDKDTLADSLDTPRKAQSDRLGFFPTPDSPRRAHSASSSLHHIPFESKNLSLTDHRDFHRKTNSETHFFDSTSFGDTSEWPTSDEESSIRPSTIGESAYFPSNASTLTKSESNIGRFGIPFSAFISDCIIEPLASRYQHINKKLMNLLTTDCCILKRLETAQRFFFISQPISDLYSLSVLPSLWSYTAIGEVTLNHWLKLAIESNMDALKFDVDLSDFYGASLHIIQKQKTKPLAQSTDSKIEEGEDGKILKRLEDISKVWIEFDAPWPASLFLNNDTHELYNNISSSLSVLMAAQFALEQLTTQNKFVTEESRSTVHQMHLFKSELLCFLRNLREYMVSRVLQVPWKELEKELLNAADLDEMLNRHRNFLVQIRERCLLTERFAALRKALDRMVEIALDFSRLFQLIHASLDPNSRSTNMNTTHASSFSHNILFDAGVGIDTKAIARVWTIVEKSRVEFTRLLKFLLSVLSKMASSSIHLADLYLRLNFSNFYQE